MYEDIIEKLNKECEIRNLSPRTRTGKKVLTVPCKKLLTEICKKVLTVRCKKLLTM